ncbi:MAG: 4Fe-4S binding protein [bacterium]|nr:4Fe-4S binding protein [bacterium]
MKDLVIHKVLKVPTEPKVPKTNEDLCIGCSVCVKICPVKDVISLVKEPVLEGVFSVIAEIPKDKMDIKVAIGDGKTCSLPEFCIRCRRCVEECPTDARTF